MNLNIDIVHLVVGAVVVACLIAAVVIGIKTYRKIKRKKAKGFYKKHIEALEPLPADINTALQRSRDVAKILADESMSEQQRLTKVSDCADLKYVVSVLAPLIDDVDLCRKNYHKYNVSGHRTAYGLHNRLKEDLKRMRQVLETVDRLTQRSGV